MITQKPISGVAFCLFAELRSALNRLKSVDYWYAIEHLPEEEEKKLHCHFIIIPSGRIDTCALRCDIPHCLPLRSSKIDDWFLYSLHDNAYLMLHGISKKRNYHLFEMQTNLPNSQDAIEATYNQSIETLGGAYNRIKAVSNMASNGCDWSACLISGLIPPNQVQFYKELFFNISPRPWGCLEKSVN